MDQSNPQSGLVLFDLSGEPPKVSHVEDGDGFQYLVVEFAEEDALDGVRALAFHHPGGSAAIAEELNTWALEATNAADAEEEE